MRNAPHKPHIPPTVPLPCGRQIGRQIAPGGLCTARNEENARNGRLQHRVDSPAPVAAPQVASTAGCHHDLCAPQWRAGLCGGWHVPASNLTLLF
jgi:hypothetical protein